MQDSTVHLFQVHPADDRRTRSRMGVAGNNRDNRIDTEE